MTARMDLQMATQNTDLLAILQEKTAQNNNIWNIRSKTYKRNEYIYLAPKMDDKIYVIQKGRVKVGTNQEGPRELIKNVLREGEFFGELSMMGTANRVHFALAMEETTIYVLSRERLNLLIKEHPQLIGFLLQTIGGRLLDMEQRLESMVFRSSRSRIIDFVKNQVNRRGQRVGYEMLVRGFFTHQEIASLTATSRQTVTTVLNELKSKNILVFNRRRLLVRNMDLLLAEAA